MVSIRYGPQGTRLRLERESSVRTAGKPGQRDHSDDFFPLS